MTKVCPAATTVFSLFQLILISPLDLLRHRPKKMSFLFGSLAGFLRPVFLPTSASSFVTFYRVQPPGQKPGVGSYGARSEHSAPFGSD